MEKKKLRMQSKDNYALFLVCLQNTSWWSLLSRPQPCLIWPQDQGVPGTELRGVGPLSPMHFCPIWHKDPLASMKSRWSLLTNLLLWNVAAGGTPLGARAAFADLQKPFPLDIIHSTPTSPVALSTCLPTPTAHCHQSLSHSSLKQMKDNIHHCHRTVHSLILFLVRVGYFFKDIFFLFTFN